MPRAHQSDSGATVVSWEVVLPERTAAPLGASKPRATVRLDLPGGTEDLKVPLAVGKALDKRKQSSETPLICSSRAELLWTIHEQEDVCARERLHRLFERRDYSSHEASDKLRRDGYPSSVVDDVIASAVSGHLIDDLRFADVFIRSKVTAGWGSYRIERELERKGVDPSTVPGWPDEYLDSQTEADRAYQVISSRHVPERNPYEKMVRFLGSRGFSLTVAKDVSRRVLEEHDLWRS